MQKSSKRQTAKCRPEPATQSEIEAPIMKPMSSATQVVCSLLMVSGFIFASGRGNAEPSLPLPTKDGGFATSDTCRACHPGPYHSWRGSFHRTMTQASSPEALLGNFDVASLTDRGHTTRFSRRGDEVWVDIPDPAWFLDPDPNKIAVPPRINVPIVMTTGSHHMQYYWVRRPASGPVHERPDHGAMMNLPWVWLIEDERWIPVQDSFLTPREPEAEVPLMWNTSCFACHSVATQPRYIPVQDRFDSRSVELGIACEACHGPAGEHAKANRSPLRRYLQYFGDDSEGDPTIVNPARLTAARSRDVCGQCHSFGEPRDSEAHKETGVAFRAGDVLAETSRIYQYPRTPAEAQALRDSGTILGGNFWPDGTIRVAGREYNGLMESKCATNGELTCLSCHSMHSYEEPTDQLAQGKDQDQACADCHTSIATNVEQHTHHAPGSAGSRCVNCHMPHTTYGLFVAMRSHRIDSPSVANQVSSGRPIACNLCHLDKPLAWTNEKLHGWYGHERVALDADDTTIAASVLWAIKGDAVQRGLVAWHMGWAPARSISGDKWIGAYLSLLLADPYAAVRRVADQSIRSLPGFAGFEYDFVAEPQALGAKQAEAIERWKRAMAGKPNQHGPHLLQNANGDMDQSTLNRIFKMRDHQAIRISE
ncbi:MAG: hypothetical protein ACI8W3_001297 [Myxococcota bacterium]